MPSTPWKNRIVGHSDRDPRELCANPLNYRVHPLAQAEGLRAVLDQVGLVQGVIVNRTTGRLIDGHLRVDAAIGNGEATIPVTEVELTEEEERLVLATFDPLGAMAGVDAELLDSLLGEVASTNESAAIAGILATLEDARVGVVPFPELPTGDRPPLRQMAFVVSEEQEATVRAALAKARPLCVSGENENSNGNALALVCRSFLG
jgi:ParB-like chromosome segregation protein Spo0J